MHNLLSTSITKKGIMRGLVGGHIPVIATVSPPKGVSHSRLTNLLPSGFFEAHFHIVSFIKHRSCIVHYRPTASNNTIDNNTNMSALPDNVKAVISRLSVQDQVVIRSYIAGMRDELKEMKVKLEHADDDDPHAHYHGHEVS